MIETSTVPSSALLPSTAEISIAVTIDAEAVLRRHPDPSQDREHPTVIEDELGYMVAVGTTIFSGQGTGALSVKGAVGGVVYISTTSGSQNFADSVRAYEISKDGDDTVFGPFELRRTPRPIPPSIPPSIIDPASTSGVLPAQTRDEKAWCYRANIANEGTERLGLKFALYGRGENAGQAEPLGYFCWKPTITVASSHPPVAAGISIMVTLDTDAIQKDYPNPGRDSGTPTVIGNDRSYVIATGTTVTSGQGTADLRTTSAVGDKVRIFTTSGSDNFEDSVLVYDISKDDDAVLGPFEYKRALESAVAPASHTSPLPAQTQEKDFWYYQARGIGVGDACLSLKFALYTRSKKTGEPVLVGYFACSLTITLS